MCIYNKIMQKLKTIPGMLNFWFVARFSPDFLLSLERWRSFITPATRSSNSLIHFQWLYLCLWMIQYRKSIRVKEKKTHTHAVIFHKSIDRIRSTRWRYFGNVKYKLYIYIDQVVELNATTNVLITVSRLCSRRRGARDKIGIE